MDIDVVFINHQADRDNALKEIAQELQRIKELPAIQWKLQNLSHLKSKNPAKFQLQREALDERFKRQ